MPISISNNQISNCSKLSIEGQFAHLNLPISVLLALEARLDVLHHDLLGTGWQPVSLAGAFCLCKRKRRKRNRRALAGQTENSLVGTRGKLSHKITFSVTLRKKRLKHYPRSKSKTLCRLQQTAGHGEEEGRKTAER